VRSRLGKRSPDGAQRNPGLAHDKATPDFASLRAFIERDPKGQQANMCAS
jgi:hypothetical protein